MNLIDRFGPLPQQVMDLIEFIKLREIGKKLGFEKLILKNNAVGAYFPDEKKQYYYQSEIFTKVLRYVQLNPNRCKMKQKTNSLMLSIAFVTSIQQAKSIMQEILQFTGQG